jgi:UDP-N-acetylglucosamine transferase subunit ALG13
MLGGDPVIFASVGSMLPFNRLVQAVDDWADAHPGEDVFIQIGDSSYEPRHAPWVRIMPHAEYRQRLEACDLFVAHVGMGSILQGLELRKQMLLMPRRAQWREHTTDHQLHTADRFRHYTGLRIVDDVPGLHHSMSELLAHPLEVADGFALTAPQPMIDSVRRYLAAAIR